MGCQRNVVWSSALTQPAVSAIHGVRVSDKPAQYRSDSGARGRGEVFKGLSAVLTEYSV
jgi:hypothetical protein